jgi:hypothetical protein
MSSRQLDVIGPKGDIMMYAFFLTKFGRCASCMRLAVRAAMIAWLTLLVISLTLANEAVWYSALALATGLTALCAAHILAFGAHRVVMAKAGRTGVRQINIGQSGPANSPRKPLQLPYTRRDTLLLFLGGVAAATLASLAASRPAMASCGDCSNQFGSGYHDCITNFCNNQGQTCCPPGYPYLNHCDCLCYDTTEMDCNSYSNCLYCS